MRSDPAGPGPTVGRATHGQQRTDRSGALTRPGSSASRMAGYLKRFIVPKSSSRPQRRKMVARAPARIWAGGCTGGGRQASRQAGGRASGRAGGRRLSCGNACKCSGMADVGGYRQGDARATVTACLWLRPMSNAGHATSPLPLPLLPPPAPHPCASPARPTWEGRRRWRTRACCA